MKLSPRLAYISSQVPLKANVLDIGADHGYIAIELAKKNPQRRVIASDVAPLPLAAGKEHAKKQNITNIEFRLGNGLTVLTSSDAIDTVIIAGIGGKLMRTLLEEGKAFAAIQRYVLQPNNEAGIVREWLEANNYRLLSDERISERSYVYEAFVAQKQGNREETALYAHDMTERKAEFYFGPLLKRTYKSNYDTWLANKQRQLIKQKTEMLKSKSSEVQQDIAKYDKLIRYARLRLQKLGKEDG